MAESPAWTVRRVLPSREVALDDLLSETEQQLQARGWEERDQFCVRLALEEAFNNAMEHGNRRDESKSVTVDCRVEGDRFWASVADEGEGFDPEAVADCRDEENLLKTRGRGVYLMRTYMDRVHYNEKGNVIILEKSASRAAGLRR